MRFAPGSLGLSPGHKELHVRPFFPHPGSDPEGVSRLARRRGALEPLPDGTPRPPVRVLCVDDHAVLVEGLRAQFQLDGGIQLIGRLGCADDLIEHVERLRPDVIVLDIEMPGPDVFEAADRLRQAHPATRFLFLSAHVRDSYLAAAYKAGAWGYFAKGDELDDIVNGIKTVAGSPEATFVMGPKVRQRCTSNGPSPLLAFGLGPSRRSAATSIKPVTQLESLSSREVEVLRLIGKGRSRQEIATELARSVKTIDGHQDRILKKLGLDTRAELTRFAIREGLAEA